MATLKQTARSIIEQTISLRSGATLLLLYKQGRSWHHEFFPRVEYEGGRLCESSVVEPIDHAADKNAKLICIANLPEHLRNWLTNCDSWEKFLLAAYNNWENFEKEEA